MNKRRKQKSFVIFMKYFGVFQVLFLLLLLLQSGSRSIFSNFFDIFLLLPRHGVQLASTLNTFLVPIFSLGAVLFTICLKNKNLFKYVLRHFSSYVVYIALTHFFIWWVIGPDCITGCEGGAGGNDGFEVIFFTIFFVNHLILCLVAFAAWVLSRFWKKARAYYKNLLRFWIMIISYPVLFLLTSLIFGIIISLLN